MKVLRFSSHPEKGDTNFLSANRCTAVKGKASANGTCEFYSVLPSLLVL
jgi:hypothetical protein